MNRNGLEGEVYDHTVVIQDIPTAKLCLDTSSVWGRNVFSVPRPAKLNILILISKGWLWAFLVHLPMQFMDSQPPHIVIGSGWSSMSWRNGLTSLSCGQQPDRMYIFIIPYNMYMFMLDNSVYIYFL